VPHSRGGEEKRQRKAHTAFMKKQYDVGYQYEISVTKDATMN